MDLQRHYFLSHWHAALDSLGHGLRSWWWCNDFLAQFKVVSKDLTLMTAVNLLFLIKYLANEGVFSASNQSIQKLNNKLDLSFYSAPFGLPALPLNNQACTTKMKLIKSPVGRTPSACLMPEQ